METFGEERLHTVKSSAMPFVLAFVVGAPLVFVGIQGVRAYSAYRESTWYSDMGQWFTRHAEESRAEADKYRQWSREARTSAESTSWKTKASEQVLQAEHYEEQAQLCKEKAQGWTKRLFSGGPSAGARKGQPGPVNSSLTAVGLPHGP